MAETYRSGAVPRGCGARRLLLIALLVAAGACERGAKTPPLTTEKGVRATVVTIRTVVEPEKKTVSHKLVIAGNLARSMDEADVWHLYDASAGRVTTIDEIAGTYRVRTLAELQAERNKQPESPNVLEAAIARGPEAPVILGLQTEQWLITAGAYRRELFLAKSPKVPPKLFSLIYASRLAESTAAGVTPRIDAVLLARDGFPLIDRAVLPFGEALMRVERTVISIEERQVPAAWLRVPDKSRDTTPKPKS